MKRSEMPQQGILQGVRVVVCAVSIAGPFAGELMAEMGAEVIQIESPKIRTMPTEAVTPDGWEMLCAAICVWLPWTW